MKKLLVSLAAAVIVVAGGAGIYEAVHDTSKPAPKTSQTAQTKKADSSDISYQGIEGQSALALLKQSYKVETKEYSGLGEMVTSINGQAADSQHFWAFYVNGKQSQEGAGSYMTKTGDKIAWKLEKVQ